MFGKRFLPFSVVRTCQRPGASDDQPFNHLEAVDVYQFNESYDLALNMNSANDKSVMNIFIVELCGSIMVITSFGSVGLHCGLTIEMHACASHLT